MVARPKSLPLSTPLAIGEGCEATMWRAVSLSRRVAALQLAECSMRKEAAYLSALLMAL